MSGIIIERRVVSCPPCMDWVEVKTPAGFPARSPDSHSGQISKLIWHAMKSSAERGRTFDFSAVGTPGSVLFYANFGGVTQPRYVVHKETSVFDLLDFSRRKLRSLQARMATAISRPRAARAAKASVENER